MSERYARQTAFDGIGKAGQARLAGARVAIIGLGALGTVSADHLARAGVGFLRLVDRDDVEYSNLQRQILYTEADASERRPKALAAAAHLTQINSEIRIEPAMTDANSRTIDALIGDVNLVIDATDNLETRYLINEACNAHGIPWIYGAAVGAQGMTMTILPEEDAPCFACFTQAESGGPTCATAGVLNTLTGIIASLQCTEAIKLLTGSGRLKKGLRIIDLWHNEDETVIIPKREDCPVCVRHEYKYYGKRSGMSAIYMCGRHAVQIVPENEKELDFAAFAKTLEKVPEAVVTFNDYILDMRFPEYDIRLFKNGRAIIRNVDDEKKAKSIYAEYIGLS